MSLSVGVIGYGYWGPKLVRNLVASKYFTIRKLADRQATVRDKVRQEFPEIDVLDDGAALIADPDIDAVVIATPVETHFPLARAALLAGKHVLVEKPMCTSIAEADELIALAERQGRILMVDHTFLFTGAVQAIKTMVTEGSLGRICYFDSMRVNLGLFQPDVNVLWDLAPHDFSILDYILDESPIHIEATGYCHVNDFVPDVVYLSMHYRSPVIAHFNFSWMSPVKVRRVAIGGTERMLVWDDLSVDEKIKVYNAGIDVQPQEDRSIIIPGYRLGDIFSPRVPGREALSGVIEHFAQVIRGETQSIMGGEQGRRVVSTLEQAQAALDSNLRRIHEMRKSEG